ncbi:hypothetical protein HYP06_gp092 [Vibrio phage vB_VspP_pVa5]|uniref:Uncharacterized protein n=1 Tax=Vibrio phage vB_VspP_pVa5 TaxID=1913109 RepID=A0A1J0GV95_9CAUD|nr:hypothetical protein HYP06_gp092 [Vibrio phage vB_VspP_pVa5]APC46106.1 hypothetical protein vBVspPpVa5_0081 [Vibrio phage vB_VspP_pVa5]
MKTHEIRLMKRRMEEHTRKGVFQIYEKEWYNYINPVNLANWFVHYSSHSHAELLQCAKDLEVEAKMEALLEG